jgi:hypothetical protein
MSNREPHSRRDEPGEELPPPPPLSSFVEHSTGRLLVEAAVGASAAWILSFALGAPDEGRLGFLLAGAVVAPAALLLTPLRGALMVRALRYGGALAVVGMLFVSFTGPGRERPIDELLAIGIVLLGVGAVGHGLRIAAAGGGDETDEEDLSPRE